MNFTDYEEGLLRQAWLPYSDYVYALIEENALPSSPISKAAKRKLEFTDSVSEVEVVPKRNTNTHPLKLDAVQLSDNIVNPNSSTEVSPSLYSSLILASCNPKSSFVAHSSTGSDLSPPMFAQVVCSPQVNTCFYVSYILKLLGIERWFMNRDYVMVDMLC